MSNTREDAGMKTQQASDAAGCATDDIEVFILLDPLRQLFHQLAGLGEQRRLAP
jgi:hypothetical protein